MNITWLLRRYSYQRRRYARRKRNTLIQIQTIRRRRQRWLALLQMLFSQLLNVAKRDPLIRSCRRLPRNTGWWNTILSDYSDRRFKKNFRVSKATFDYLVSNLKNLERKTMTEEPISVAECLAITLYRLGRETYYHTLSEMSGIGESTISEIVPEVCEALIENLWGEYVTFPTSEDEYREKLNDMGHLWQFKYAFCAIDGCHVPIKCPAGGNQARKSYHNFKKFYSVVLMAMVDAKLRFVWASCGFRGNSHDSTIFQSTAKYADIVSGNVLPDKIQLVNEDPEYPIPPLILGDSAFPLLTWLLKPYGDAIPSGDKRYFNYRLSRARTVSECAFGQLKGRFRILLRQCETSKDTHKLIVLAFVLLHNICINRGDMIPSQSDLSVNENGERRTSTEFRNMLNMIESQNDTSSPTAKPIRNKICDEFWAERLSASDL